MSAYDSICVIILLYTAIYVSAYDSIRVIILLYTAIYVSAYYSICVIILLYTAIYVSAYDSICVIILLYICPQTSILLYVCPHAQPYVEVVGFTRALDCAWGDVSHARACLSQLPQLPTVLEAGTELLVVWRVGGAFWLDDVALECSGGGGGGGWWWGGGGGGTPRDEVTW